MSGYVNASNLSDHDEEIDVLIKSMEKDISTFGDSGAKPRKIIAKSMKNDENHINIHSQNLVVNCSPNSLFA